MDTPHLLLEHYLKQLRLPTMMREYPKLAEASATVTAKIVSRTLGRESWLIRSVRPVYESVLHLIYKKDGMPWVINGVEYRIAPHQRHRLWNEYDHSVAEFLRKRVRDGHLYFDVGANVGAYVLQFRQGPSVYASLRWMKNSPCRNTGRRVKNDLCAGCFRWPVFTRTSLAAFDQTAEALSNSCRPKMWYCANMQAALTILIASVFMTSCANGQMKFSVKTDKQTYRSGEPIQLTWKLHNGTDHTWVVLDYYLAGRQHFDQITLYVDGPLGRGTLPLSGLRTASRVVACRLRPGDTLENTVSLLDWAKLNYYQMPPGTYHISATFEHRAASWRPVLQGRPVTQCGPAGTDTEPKATQPNEVWDGTLEAPPIFIVLN